MNRKWFATLAPFAIAGTLLVGAPALAAPAPVEIVPKQIVIVLGTPNMWVADSQGVIHFVGDPRALAVRPVDWQTGIGLPLDLVATLPRGDPWLSAAFVKIGNEIYLPQVDPSTNATGLTLRRITTPSDLSLLGVDADNYGEYVLEAPAWEHRYGMSLTDVVFAGDFALTPPPIPTETVTPAEETPAATMPAEMPPAPEEGNAG
jgi:hypothetical protein